MLSENCIFILMEFARIDMLPLGYFSLSLCMTLTLFLLGNQALIRSQADNLSRKRLLLLAALLGWQLYIYLMAASGILQDYRFPPRFVLLLILPAFIFTGIFAYRNRQAAWLRKLPPQWLVYYQSFRVLIETLFVFSVAQGVLQPQVTIEGYNFDIVYAATAPLIAYLAYSKKLLSERLVLGWNYLGLVVIASIIFLFMTTTYFPEWYGSTRMLLPKEFAMYPYVLVPGFLMPSAVFVHVLSIVQLHGRLSSRTNSLPSGTRLA